MEKSRTGLLMAISDWLKLLALVVLVAECVILAAMKLTPHEHSIHAWYPIFMLLFLSVVVVGVFVDRYLQSKGGREDLKVEIEGINYKVPTRDPIPVDPSSITGPIDKLFVDSERAFQFELPKSAGWSKPERLDFGQYLMRSGILTDQDTLELARAGMNLIPMGKMIAESSALCVGYGDPIEAVLTDETTTRAAETFIERMVALAEKEGTTLDDDVIQEIRRGLLTQQLPIKSLRIQNGLNVLTMEKKLAQDSPLKPTLANLFRQLIQQAPPLDKLVANERAIVWGSTMTIKNVRINEELREVTINTLNHLTEGEEYFYLVTIFYSPQTEEALTIWNELQSMSSSFNRLRQTWPNKQLELVS